MITIKGGDLFELLHLHSAIDEDVYNYSKGQIVYAFISPCSLWKYDSYFDVAVLSDSKDGLIEKIIAIVHGILDYLNKYNLLKHLLNVSSYKFENVGMYNGITAFSKYFGLNK